MHRVLTSVGSHVPEEVKVNAITVCPFGAALSVAVRMTVASVAISGLQLRVATAGELVVPLAVWILTGLPSNSTLRVTICPPSGPEKVICRSTRDSPQARSILSFPGRPNAAGGWLTLKLFSMAKQLVLPSRKEIPPFALPLGAASPGAVEGWM